jgi:hypothetical protein
MLTINQMNLKARSQKITMMIMMMSFECNVKYTEFQFGKILKKEDF